MQLTPTQESFVKDWLNKRKEPAVLRKRNALGGTQKDQNPKWIDDTWFEKRYGDPEYYSRIKGLS